LFGENTDTFGPIDEDAVAVEQSLQVVECLREVFDERADFFNDQRRKVISQTADAGHAGMKSLAGNRLEDVVNDFALIKRVKEESECPGIEAHCARAEQVIADAGQLRNDGA